MSRWFRLYDDLVDDPKIQRLPGETVKALINLWCLTSQNDGLLPAIDDIAFKLRMKQAKVEHLLSVLGECGLIDSDEIGLRPHNWNERQYKSDTKDPTAPTRQKAYRERIKNRNATVTVTDTRTETEQIQKTEQVSEPIGSGAEAPIDHRKRLFDEGLPKLARLTGKGPDACRSFVGKCLKAAGDDAITVLGLIEEAERNQAVDPSAWIVSRLKPVEIPNGRRTVHDAARSLSRHLQALDEPAPGLCEPTGGSPLRLLPAR